MMAYSNEMVGAFPPSLKWQAPQYKRQTRVPLKSQPFDPDDLRRRLNAVVAEREAQEKRQRGRFNGSSDKRMQGEKDQHPAVEGGYSMTTMTKSTRAVSEATAQAERPSNLKTKPSLQDRLRHKAFATANALPDDDAASYRHTPEQAAAQFSRTTTASSRQPTSQMHRFSMGAFRHYSEGASSSHHDDVDSSSTFVKRRTLLQRARGHRERQSVNFEPEDGVSRRRSCKTRPRPGEATRLEADGVTALADLHLQSYPSQGQRVGDDGELLSSEDTLIDAATANEHRVDWTQRDEIPAREKKGMRFHPLLQKTTSILTLRGKLGRNSDKNKAAAAMPVPGATESADEVEADDGSTTMSPDSRSSKYSGRVNVWGRLKRS